MKDIGTKITQFTNLYFQENNRVAKTNTKTLSIDHQIFLYYLLEKMVENYATVGELLKQSEKPGYLFLKNSIYILLRGIISDVIIAWWIFTDDKTHALEDEMFNAKVRQLERDHIKYHLSHLRGLEKYNLLTKEDKDFDVNILLTEFGDLFSAEEKLDYKLMLDIKSAHITSMLTDFTKKNDIFVDAYKTYFTLSKVEHTGGFTRMILERTYTDDNPMDEHLIHSIFIIEITLKVFIPQIFSEPDFVKKITEFRIVSKNK